MTSCPNLRRRFGVGEGGRGNKIVVRMYSGCVRRRGALRFETDWTPARLGSAGALPTESNIHLAPSGASPINSPVSDVRRATTAASATVQSSGSSDQVSRLLSQRSAHLGMFPPHLFVRRLCEPPPIVSSLFLASLSPRPQHLSYYQLL